MRAKKIVNQSSDFPVRRTGSYRHKKALLLLLNPFNGLFSRASWVSHYQKGKTSLDLNEARDDGVGFWDGSGISSTICKLHLAPDR